MKDLIKNGDKVFTHCYSTSVIDFLKEAKKAGKKFQVFCTETRPKLLGRRTAKALAKAKIPVTIMPDLAGTIAIKDCDIFLSGIEKIKDDGNLLNKTATLNFIEIARKHKIPCYAITRTKKNKSKAKLRKNTKEQVWKNPPEGIKIFNPAFEEIPKKLIKVIYI